MKNLSLKRFCVSFATIAVSLSIFGCSMFNSSNMGESESTATTQLTPVPADIDVIERNDTTGTVTAAREAAANLIANAKADAARIIANAKMLSAPEQAAIRASFSADVQKDSKLRVAALLAAAKKQSDAKVAKANAQAAKTIADAKKKADDIVAKAKAKATKIIAGTKNASKKADAIIAKAQNQATKKLADSKKATKKAGVGIEKAKSKAAKIVADANSAAKKAELAILAQATKSAEDIIRKSWTDAGKMKSEAKKVLELSKTYVIKAKKDADLYVGKKKSDADIYLTKKMGEADKAAADFQKQMKKKDAGTLKVTEGETPAMANKMLSGVLSGMASGDYAAFTKNFTKDLKKNLTEKNFKLMNAQLKEKIGVYKSREYLGSIKKGPLTVYLWKAKYAKADNNDLVLRLALGKLDDKLSVFAFDVSNL